ncbi:MAG: allantoate amidohydrolase [Chloroflexi bacterium]|nr:allantoate amidohydrolase [Chloroflexota bacterium]
MSRSGAIRPNSERLRTDWERLSRFRMEGLPGWTRRPFTPEYRAAREWLTGRMADAGLAVAIDAAGNVIGRREGKRPALAPLIIGSHTDTVMGGGRFDGIAGVLGGIEVARCLAEAQVELEHPLEVIDFLAEEPTDFGISAVGSRGMVGSLDAEAFDRRDPEGRTLAEAIALMGGRPDKIPGAIRRPGSAALYLELHIEQGPVLEREGLRLGIVSGITGIARYRLEIEGRPDHAGTTPMSLRRDALAAAADVVLALEALWAAGPDGSGVGTVGRLAVRPNAANVVPGFVELWAEMRNVDAERLAQKGQIFQEQVKTIAARRDVGVRIDAVSHEEPVPVPEPVQALLEAIVRELGQPVRRLPSYAGHDATHLAKIAPIGMLFVPSQSGRSHCPEEWTNLEDVTLGVQALGEALVRFDAQDATR